MLGILFGDWGWGVKFWGGVWIFRQILRMLLWICICEELWLGGGCWGFAGFGFAPICSLIVPTTKYCDSNQCKQNPSLVVSHGKLLYSLLLIRATGNRLPDFRQFGSDLTIGDTSNQWFLWASLIHLDICPLNLPTLRHLSQTLIELLVKRSFSYRRQIPCILFHEWKKNTRVSFIDFFRCSQSILVLVPSRF